MELNKESNVLLNVEGMTCSNCALGIKNYLERQGLHDVSVNFSTAEVSFNSTNNKNLSTIKKGIENLGYKVVDEDKRQEKKGLSTIEKKFIFTVPFTFVLIVSMFIPWDVLHNPILHLILATPVYVLGMWHFGKSAWSSLKTGIPNMDVLITLGASAAYIYSVIGIIENLGPEYVFFETAAAIISLVLLGNVIEHRSVRKTTNAIKELSALQPEKAKIVTKNAQGEKEINEAAITDLTAGDLLQVNTGDKIPVDGRILEGTATLDESMITGESMPVEKKEGDQVIGGTIVTNGSIIFRATAIGSDTVLSKIIKMVKEAQMDKPPIQRLADTISAYFVPAVTLISILTFVISYWAVGLPLQSALMHSIAVLVIACPCAMGLATPTAVMVGIGRAAKQGILIKGGNTVERLAKVKQIVFDKTGTLTTGKFRLKEITVYEGDEDEIKNILVGLEKHSSHPIAKAVVEELKSHRPLEMVSVKEIKGVGLEAKDAQGNAYRAGSYRMAEGLTDEQHHNIYLVRNEQLIASIDIEDTLKPEAREVIVNLNNSGYTTILLSGDTRKKVEDIAGQLGIKEFYAEQLPEEKLKVIEQLSEMRPTAMVGDGINDAPALAKADVGISLGNATQVAIQSAEVILLNGNLENLQEALRLGKHTVMTIKQNLFWAFFYNVLAIPIAAVGLLRPMIAALSMAFSDVIVIGNSIRLRTKNIRK